MNIILNIPDEEYYAIKATIDKYRVAGHLTDLINYNPFGKLAYRLVVQRENNREEYDGDKALPRTSKDDSNIPNGD